MLRQLVKSLRDYKNYVLIPKPRKLTSRIKNVHSIVHINTPKIKIPKRAHKVVDPKFVEISTQMP